MIIVRETVKGLSRSAVSRYLSATQEAVGLRGEVNVLLTNSKELRALNSRFRRNNRPTDMLSFPPMMATDELAGDVAISSVAIIGGNDSMSVGRLFRRKREF